MKRDKRETVTVQVFYKKSRTQHVDVDNWIVSSDVYQVYYMAFITPSCEVVPMVDYRWETAAKPYKYSTLNDVIHSILMIAKENNKRIPYYENFDRRWYSILFIDMDHPDHIDKYGYRLCGSIFQRVMDPPDHIDKYGYRK